MANAFAPPSIRDVDGSVAPFHDGRIGILADGPVFQGCQKLPMLSIFADGDAKWCSWGIVGTGLRGVRVVDEHMPPVLRV